MLRTAIRSVVPTRIRREIRNALDRRALARFPSAPIADVERLSPPRDLDALLRNDAADRAWARTAEELRAFRLPDETGGMTPGECRLMYYLTAALRPAAFLEIGTHIGSSTTHIAAALRDHAPGSTLVSVDIADVNDRTAGPWVTRGGIDSPQGLVDRLGMNDRARFVTTSSLDFLRTNGGTYDCILLDGEHYATLVYEEVRAALPRLRRGGVIVLHDYFHDLAPLWRSSPAIPGPFLALERLHRDDPRIGVQRFPELPWPTKEGSHRTCIALVCRGT